MRGFVPTMPSRRSSGRSRVLLSGLKPSSRMYRKPRKCIRAMGQANPALGAVLKGSNPFYPCSLHVARARIRAIYPIRESLDRQRDAIAVFIAKTIQPQVVSKAIENAGRSWLESRRAAKEPDQPQEPKLPAPVRTEGNGRSKERYNRSGISFIGTLVDDKPAKPPE